MQISSGKQEIAIYGVSMAIILLLLKWLEAHFLVFNYKLDLFIGCIAIVFTILGIWLALKLVKPKVQQVVIEKEVFITTSHSSEISESEIEKSGLSKRELEVLNLIASGYSNEEISEKLFVSVNTIKTHSSNIFVKLDVKRRTQATEKAKRLRIIP